MATAPEVVRAQLAVVTAAASSEMRAVTSGVAIERQATVLLDTLPLVVPAYYDAAGSLAVAWYDERRAEAAPRTSYTPAIIGDPTTDWIEREAAKFRQELDATDLEASMRQMTDEIALLAEKEIARGFRDSITGNTRMDEDAIGWSRVARSGACKFCLMLAGKGSVYRSESTAIFAAHKNCNCATRPEFRGGDYGSEASVIQYQASSRRAKDDAVQAERNERLRTYLNEHFPGAPG